MKINTPQIAAHAFIGIILNVWVCGAQNLTRERSLFNDGWLFQKRDPANILSKDSKGLQISSLDYAFVKPWICANGADLILPGDSAQATIPPEGGLGGGVAYTQSRYDDGGWRKLNLPHDWGIEGDFSYDLPGGTGKLPWAGTGWYRKHFKAPAADKWKQTFIDIDGAMAYPMVWLNGKFVGGWAYGYSSFRLNLTPYLRYGAENVIAIRVSNPENSSRWYPGSGIYRNVWMVKTGPVHVGHWGTFITTPHASKQSAKIDLKITVENALTEKTGVSVSAKIFETDSLGNKKGPAISSTEPLAGKIAAAGSFAFSTSATISNPRLWSPDKPNQYVAVTTVEHGGKTVDTYETRFGIRTLKFDPERGFFLNGERLRINGVCNHHDLGALGTAFNTRAAERQLEIMKEMGVNALRTSHNMPAPELLDLCDRMGILVMDESFDCWRKGKTPNDYSVLFDDWHARDLRAEVRRDRNHPSVILWSSGNEIPDVWNNKTGGPLISADLSAIIRSEDTTRLIINAGINGQKGTLSGFRNSVDMLGWNYDPFLYAKAQQDYPGWPILGSETSSAVSSRGLYYFPVSDNKNQGRGLFQVSSYDLYAPYWGTTPDDEFYALDHNPNVFGEFVWTGFDYIGEPTPFNNDVTNLLNFHDPVERAKAAKELQELGTIRAPSRSSYFGTVDLCGFKKDRFYLYQAHWRPELPMAHILPHWSWPDRVGQFVQVHVYTSGNEAELFLNGKSLGRKTKGQYQYRLRWDSVVYQPGTLTVVAYKDGKKWGADSVKTTGSAAAIRLTADRGTIRADNSDLSFITVAVVDKDGLQVPQANNLIKFEIHGPGEIAGTDNGDATGFESFLAKQHTAFNGLAMVIVRAKSGVAGKITVNAISDGLKNGTIEIKSR